jgi:hypothetical protein
MNEQVHVVQGMSQTLFSKQTLFSNQPRSHVCCAALFGIRQFRKRNSHIPMVQCSSHAAASQLDSEQHKHNENLFRTVASPPVHAHLLTGGAP